MNAAPPSPLFLLLVRDPADGDPEPAEAEVEKIRAWLRDLKARGHLVALHPLDKTGGRVLRGPARVLDGPFVEAKEVVGGFVIVSARDLAHAAELAAGFPGYALGCSVEVRALVALPGFD